MKSGRNIKILSITVALILVGCGNPGDFDNTIVVMEADEELMTSEEPRDIRTGDVEPFIGSYTCTGSTVSYVGFKGHIKEFRGEWALISSDTDGFPGVFWVRDVKELTAPEEPKGGIPVFVLMEDLGEKEEDGIARYRAERCFALPEDGGDAQVDVLLTDAPSFVLTDVLSSRYDPFEIRSGNYHWTVEEGGEGRSTVACGTTPLEEAAMKNAARLKLPSYNGMDDVGYSFSTTIIPDKLTVRQWPAEEIGNGEAKEELVSVYYDVVPFLDLRAGKVYEFTAQWKEENRGRRKYSGTASYVVTTE